MRQRSTEAAGTLTWTLTLTDTESVTLTLTVIVFQCSVTCGKGRQSRTVFCGDPDTDSDDIWCKDIPPPLSQPCNKGQCKGQ